METFTEARPFVENPLFAEQRQASLQALDLVTIDDPIMEIVKGFMGLPYCFTLQSCFGHFLTNDRQDIDNLDTLPASESVEVIEYRIAYVALCIEDSPPGRELFAGMEKIAATDPEYIQFGSADWFWERQVNSYAIQVEPRTHMFKDRCHIDYRQALRVEQVRNRFFDQIRTLLPKRKGLAPA